MVSKPLVMTTRQMIPLAKMGNSERMGWRGKTLSLVFQSFIQQIVIYHLVCASHWLGTVIQS